MIDAVANAVSGAFVPDATKVKGNNGFGNVDQTAPGNSATHNNAENSLRAQAAAAAKSKG